MGHRKAFISWAILTLILAACGSNAATPQPDQVATQVAVARAVAATLTAAAPTTIPPSITAAPPTVMTTPEPTSAAPPADTAASEPPATLPLVPSSTPGPTKTAPRPPTPTRTPVAEAADPFVPGVGTPKGLIGKIVLPGYSGPLDPPVFRDRIVFKLVVFDPAFGNVDGAGIKAVSIKATDPLGRTVIEQNEGSWAYCAFGNAQNSPDCDVWRFGEHQNTWPNGIPVCADPGYSVDLVVETDNPATNGANWHFEFAIKSPDGSLASCS